MDPETISEFILGHTEYADNNPNKDTHAPLELMAELLTAEMGQDYHFAKKITSDEES